MPFELKFTPEAVEQFNALSKNKNLAKQFKSVKKALGFLAADPAYPSLHTHNYDSIEGPEKTEVFEACAENKTPAAYRIFWCYYPPKKEQNAMGVNGFEPHIRKSHKSSGNFVLNGNILPEYESDSGDRPLSVIWRFSAT